MACGGSPERHGHRLRPVEPPHTLVHGESRIIRTAYYEGPGYVVAGSRGVGLWRELEDESGATILTMTGALMISSPSPDVSPARCRARGHGGCEALRAPMSSRLARPICSHRRRHL
jgi:sarcosine oxidase